MKFTVAERSALRDDLIEAARRDAQITGIALTGSSASGMEDEWSDVDLAFAMDVGSDRKRVIEEWTKRMYEKHGAIHHVDLKASSGLFRSFLLPSTLQVDIGFWPKSEFGAIGPAFKLLDGEASVRPPLPLPTFERLVGMGWLYALHVRSSIARGRFWQAEHMLAGFRGQILTLACLRYDLPTLHGRGLDRLPQEVRSSVASTLVTALNTDELNRAFGVSCEAFLAEVGAVAVGLAGKLASPMLLVAHTDRGTSLSNRRASD